MTAASALRNLVFKNLANKEEVLRAGVLTSAVQLLQDSSSAETHKHVTGKQLHTCLHCNIGDFKDLYSNIHLNNPR